MKHVKNEKELAWALALVGTFFLIFMLCVFYEISEAESLTAETLTVNSMRIQNGHVQYKYSHSLKSESPIMYGHTSTNLPDLEGLALWVDTDVYEDTASGHVTSYIRVCTLKEGERFSERKCVYLEFGK